jgi:hypothetical protein
MAAELLEDVDDAAGDVAAVRVLRNMLQRAAAAGLASSQELGECLDALDRLYGLIIDWHGEAVVEMLDATDRGSA